MTRQQVSPSTTQFNYPTWNGGGFFEGEPNSLWVRLPESLRSIASAEVSAGNSVLSILENSERGIILLSLERGPLVSIPQPAGIQVHTQHEYGNYCYEGTKATYQDIQSGCFLAFEDPLFQWPAC